MWYKGISFTNENSAITYLVDAAGARTTTDHFVSQNMYDNLLNGIFYELVSSAYSRAFIRLWWEHIDFS